MACWGLARQVSYTPLARGWPFVSNGKTGHWKSKLWHMEELSDWVSSTLKVTAWWCLSSDDSAFPSSRGLPCGRYYRLVHSTHILILFKLCFLYFRTWKAQCSLSQTSLQLGLAMRLSQWETSVHLPRMSLPFLLLPIGMWTWWVELWQIPYKHEEKVKSAVQLSPLLSDTRSQLPFGLLAENPSCFKPLRLGVPLLVTKCTS